MVQSVLSAMPLRINSFEALLLVVSKVQKSKLGGYHLMTATFVRADIPHHCTYTIQQRKEEAINKR